MNLESGSNMTQNNSLSRLKAASKTALQTITETPYQPIVYAIPKEDWNAFQQYLKEAITFQPTLHEQIADLMTKAELEDTLETTTSALSKWSKQFSDEVIDSTESIVPRVSRLLSETERELSRDGRMREEFLKNLKEEEDERISYFEDLMKKLNRKILFFFIVTASGSALFSVLICLLMR